jgi:hypothetical protein
MARSRSKSAPRALIATVAVTGAIGLSLLAQTPTPAPAARAPQAGTAAPANGRGAGKLRCGTVPYSVNTPNVPAVMTNVVATDSPV